MINRQLTYLLNMLIKMDKSISNIYNQELSDLQIKNAFNIF